MVNGHVSAFTIINTIGIIYSMVLIYEASESVIFGHTQCDDPYAKQELILGIWMLLQSVLGLICSKWHNMVIRVIYLFFLILLIIVTLWLTGVLAFGTTDGEAGQEYSRKTYELESYASWLRKHVAGEEMMMNFKKCILDENVCGKNLYPVDTLQHPIEIGCCRPPPECGYSKKNAKKRNMTIWRMPKDGIASDNPDCLKWDLDEVNYCFECDTCKSAYLAVVLRHWYDRDLFCFVYSIVLLSCFAFVVHVRDTKSTS